MTLSLDFKKRAIATFIKTLEGQLQNLNAGQRAEITDAEEDDIDSNSLVESTREQRLFEAGQLTDRSDFISRELEILRSIQTHEVMKQVEKGALIRTNLGFFLIGPAVEHITVEGVTVTGISDQSPVYKKMESLKKKAEFHFENREYIIFEIV